MAFVNVIIAKESDTWIPLDSAMIAQVQLPEGQTELTDFDDKDILQSFHISDKELGWDVEPSSEEAAGES